MLDLKSKIGEKAGPYREEITRERLEKFAAAVLATHSAAAPPTYFTRYREGEFELCRRFGIPIPRLLHGEQEYELEAPLRAGDTLSYETTLIDAAQKRGTTHALNFMYFESQFFRETPDGGRERVGVARTNLIVQGEI